MIWFYSVLLYFKRVFSRPTWRREGMGYHVTHRRAVIGLGIIKPGVV